MLQPMHILSYLILETSLREVLTSPLDTFVPGKGHHLHSAPAQKQAAWTDPVEECANKAPSQWVASYCWDIKARRDPSKGCFTTIIPGKNGQLHCIATETSNISHMGSLFLEIPQLEMLSLGWKFCRLLNTNALGKKSCIPIYALV